MTEKLKISRSKVYYSIWSDEFDKFYKRYMERITFNQLNW